jgi:hypothetical protein
VLVLMFGPPIVLTPFLTAFIKARWLRRFAPSVSAGLAVRLLGTGCLELVLWLIPGYLGAAAYLGRRWLLAASIAVLVVAATTYSLNYFLVPARTERARQYVLLFAVLTPLSVLILSAASVGILALRG